MFKTFGVGVEDYGWESLGDRDPRVDVGLRIEIA